MQPDTLISRRICWLGLPLRRRTRIETCMPPHVFVDLQWQGPYRLWRHAHRFQAERDGTVVRDRVACRLSGVPPERIVHYLLVQRQLSDIFDRRRQAVRKRLSAAVHLPDSGR